MDKSLTKWILIPEYPKEHKNLKTMCDIPITEKTFSKDLPFGVFTFFIILQINYLENKCTKINFNEILDLANNSDDENKWDLDFSKKAFEILKENELIIELSAL